MRSTWIEIMNTSWPFPAVLLPLLGHSGWLQIAVWFNLKGSAIARKPIFVWSSLSRKIFKSTDVDIARIIGHIHPPALKDDSDEKRKGLDRLVDKVFGHQMSKHITGALQDQVEQLLKENEKLKAASGQPMTPVDSPTDPDTPQDPEKMHLEKSKTKLTPTVPRTGRAIDSHFRASPSDADKRKTKSSSADPTQPFIIVDRRPVLEDTPSVALFRLFLDFFSYVEWYCDLTYMEHRPLVFMKGQLCRLILFRALPTGPRRTNLLPLLHRLRPNQPLYLTDYLHIPSPRCGLPSTSTSHRPAASLPTMNPPFVFGIARVHSTTTPPFPLSSARTPWPPVPLRFPANITTIHNSTTPGSTHYVDDSAYNDHSIASPPLELAPSESRVSIDTNVAENDTMLRSASWTYTLHGHRTSFTSFTVSAVTPRRNSTRLKLFAAMQLHRTSYTSSGPSISSLGGLAPPPSWSWSFASAI